MKEELIDLLIQKSLKVADSPVFQLVSGRMSNVYIDCKKTTLDPLGMYLIGNLIFDKISGLDVRAIGGLSLGADPISYAVAYTSYIKGHPLNAFIVRKEPKGHGTKRAIEGEVQKGERVIIVDDVVTTGGSTIKAIQSAREAGLEIVKVIVLVDRQEGGAENILNEGVDFEAIVTKQELLDEYYRRAGKAKT